MIDVLRASYGALLEALAGVDDEVGWRPTGCTGWTVRDLVFHLLEDARRALVALGTPASGPPDVDAVTYWIGWLPGTEGAGRSQRSTRIMASVWTSVTSIAEIYAETARAVLTTAGRFDGDELVATQGHVLSVRDLTSTLAVEATIHQVDLDLGAPSAAGLAEGRRVLDALLGRPVPTSWDDRHWLLVGTGRAAPTADDRDWLGADVARLPLFG